MERERSGFFVVGDGGYGRPEVLHSGEEVRCVALRLSLVLYFRRGTTPDSSSYIYIYNTVSFPLVPPPLFFSSYTNCTW